MCAAIISSSDNIGGAMGSPSSTTIITHSHSSSPLHHPNIGSFALNLGLRPREIPIPPPNAHQPQQQQLPPQIPLSNGNNNNNNNNTNNNNNNNIEPNPDILLALVSRNRALEGK